MRLTKTDYQALAGFRREVRRFLAYSETVAQDFGLPAQQYQALLAIKARGEEDAMTVGELARDLLIVQHSASELVQRLVSRGLLARLVDPDDRRRMRLSLTAEAEDILSRMAKTHIEELARMQPALLAVFTRLRLRNRAKGDGSLGAMVCSNLALRRFRLPARLPPERDVVR